MDENPYVPNHNMGKKSSTAYGKPVRDGFAVAVGIFLLNFAALMLIPSFFPMVPVSPSIEALELYCFVIPFVSCGIAVTGGAILKRFGWIAILVLMLFVLGISWLNFQLLSAIKMAG